MRPRQKEVLSDKTEILMQIIDGKATAAEIKKEIAEEVEHIVAGGGKRPHLAAVLIWHDGGSATKCWLARPAVFSRLSSVTRTM